MRIRSLVVLSSIALAPLANAQRLIAVDSGRALYKLDPATGARASIGTVTSNASTTAGLALDISTNTVYLTSTGNDSLFTLNVATGAATLVGAYGDSTLVMHGLEYHWVNNTLYGASNGSLYTIDRTTGVATLVGATGVTSFMNLCYVPTTNTMYASINGVTTGGPQDSWYSIDVSTGAATLIGSYAPAATNINGLAYDVETDTIYAVDNTTHNLYTVNRATGQVTTIGNFGSANMLGLVWLPGTGTYAGFAAGCAGTLGVPGNQLVKAANIGHTFTVNGTNLPFDAGVMVVGFSNTVFNGLPLPADLGIVGAPGCNAYVSGDMINVIFGAPASGTATYSTPVPDNALFLGMPYFTQTYSFDTVNAFGLVAGDAGGGIVGQ